MLALMECVAQAVMNKGVRGLAEFVPGGPYLLDVAGDAYRLFRERRRVAELRDELVKAAAAGVEEVKRAAGEAVRQVAAQSPIEDRLTLELYLTQIPGCVRQSLKRADDPSGKSVPADFALNTPEDLAKLLPHRVPQFRPGADLPGRSGWTLDDLLGAGGFGEVWLARHSFIPNPRAVKFCTDPLAKAKLVSHEGKVIARVMAQGHHPNVVPLVDAVLDGEAPWLMYEYVGGGSLTDLIHRWQGLPPADRERAAVGALHELAAAVATFHRLAPPIVHRDLKPSNILVNAEGGRRNAESRPEDDSSAASRSALRAPDSALRITDFGIGGVAVEYMRTHHPVGASLMTGWLETSLRGSYTPLYASPQQRAGSPPDPRDDVHALGVIGYQMVTGRLDQGPGIDAAEDLRDAGAGDGFILLLTKCVAQKPDRRPKDAGELAEKLDELRRAAPVMKPTVAPASSPPETEGKAPRHPLTPDSSPSRGEGNKASKPFAPTPMEGGDVPFAPPSAPKPSAAPVPFSAPTPPAPPKDKLQPQQAAPVPPRSPVVTQSKWLIPFRAIWFSRPTETPDVAWAAQPGRLPGEVTVKPDETYRLALPPDETTDSTLAKFRSLTQIPRLEAVDLSGCGKVTDAGLAHLAALPGLMAVGLADTAVTDSGVALLLNRFPNLEAVGLANARNVSQTVVPYLTKLRKLKLVSLPPRADTVDVRVELARRLPGCKVV
ncbi:MAG: pkn1 6 [Gemmataceae bacterium]|nr:pkn1 6 [Gemmataceae bacterium]